jgi:glutamate--cysteine ligase
MGFITKGYEDLELSTQILIRDAQKRGIKVEILDRNDNFLRLEKDARIEYLKQATRTSADTYITALIMENKTVTKEILKRHGIRVPAGKSHTDKKTAVKDFGLFSGKDIVIKPNSTNFGTGVNIIKDNSDRSKFASSIETAFKYGGTAIIEEYIEGKEYRFLVIGGKVVGIIHRIPANVTGDGIRTISELAAEKNGDPLRGEHYVTPLERIRLGNDELGFLKKNGMDAGSIPGKGVTVYLRENSNISTGGDSIDCTDDIGEEYKRIAVNAADAVGAKICGVDMIISDARMMSGSAGYAIIELNFNPALHIHAFPYKGIDRKPAEFVLDLLGF